MSRTGTGIGMRDAKPFVGVELRLRSPLAAAAAVMTAERSALAVVNMELGNMRGIQCP